VLAGGRTPNEAAAALGVSPPQYYLLAQRAMDHTEPPEPIDGRDRQILAVQDLASHYQLAWQPVERADVRQTSCVLENLFRRHGPPLVLKSDNGPAFIDGETGECSVVGSWSLSISRPAIRSTMEAARQQVGDEAA
jgi:hypothetical protein